MGLVTPIHWVCPGCGSKEKAEAYGDWDDPPEFPVDAVPSSTSLKWHPPCKSCGLYRLVMPIVPVRCYPEAIPAVPEEEN